MNSGLLNMDARVKGCFSCEQGGDNLFIRESFFYSLLEVSPEMGGVSCGFLDALARYFSHEPFCFFHQFPDEDGLFHGNRVFHHFLASRRQDYTMVSLSGDGAEEVYVVTSTGFQPCRYRMHVSSFVLGFCEAGSRVLAGLSCPYTVGRATLPRFSAVTHPSFNVHPMISWCTTA